MKSYEASHSYHSYPAGVLTKKIAVSANEIAHSRRVFLETPETFRVHNFLCILKLKTFPVMKFCNKFTLSYLEIIV